jgi:hypothetical protein
MSQILSKKIKEDQIEIIKITLEETISNQMTQCQSLVTTVQQYRAGRHPVVTCFVGK